MHIIVAGGGTVGEQVARALGDLGNTVTVIEESPTRAGELSVRGLHVITGSASSPRRLEAAGALHADVLVACTGRDEENLVVAVLARRHFEIARVVATVRDEANRWLFDQSWGVDAAISSASSLVALIESATGSTRTVYLTDLPHAGLVLIEVGVTLESRAAGQPVASLSLGDRDLVAAVLRERSILAPDVHFRFQIGDRVLVVTDPDRESAVRDAFYDDVGIVQP